MKRFVILGGGTAGWLSALILQKHIQDWKTDAEICVVESPNIPTIGVGEGTTAAFKTLLDFLGIDELEFLRETHGTVKLGIRHKDWRQLGGHYDGPIDNPHHAPYCPQWSDGTHYLYRYSVAAGRKVSDCHLFQNLMDSNKSLYMQEAGRLKPVTYFFSGYHIDNQLVGRFLSSKAQGITRLEADVSGVTRDPETGKILELVCDDGEKIHGDFFFDCTGFKRKLIQGELDVEWCDYSESLPVNRAMPFWIEHKPGEEIAPYTLAWAQKNGWMWQIPTYDRIGAGYVYDDRFTSPEQAQEEIEQVLGHAIEPRSDIKINAGRLAQAWSFNCIAVGLSSSFLEPLEATSIHGTLVQLLLFCRQYLNEALEFSEEDQAQYNERVNRQVDEFKDFINMHYVTERRDTEFWRSVADNYIQDSTKARLEQWQAEMPLNAHFDNFLFKLPHIEAQLYYPVLDGLGLLDRKLAQREMEEHNKLRQLAREQVREIEKHNKKAAHIALGHREFLDHLQQ